MANTISAKRAVRSTSRREARNKEKKALLKKIIKAARAGREDLNSAYKALDRAAGKGIVHWKYAARIKSRLANHAPGNVKQGKTATKTSPKTRSAKKTSAVKKN